MHAVELKCNYFRLQSRIISYSFDNIDLANDDYTTNLDAVETHRLP